MTKTRRRQSPDIRKKEILNAAVQVAIKVNYSMITRRMVAEKAGTSCSLVTNYFANMDLLKKLIVRTAIDNEIMPILAQAISLGDPQTRNIDKDLKQKVIAHLK